MQHNGIIQQNYNGPLSNADFEAQALKLFRHQYAQNSLYQRFADALHRSPDNVSSIENIPFLPISFFKNFKIMTGTWVPETEFHSSGTTGPEVSRHMVRDISFYTAHSLKGFESFYGPVKNMAVLALLPSYLERSTSSLVAMAKCMIEESDVKESGFYLNNFGDLAETVSAMVAAGTPTLLLGVTFALLDFAEQYPMELRHTIVMETGGMKGRKKELTRDEVHAYLKLQFGLSNIHAEYGMTELFSQAYSKGGGLFGPMHSMKVLIRDLEDPLTVAEYGTGALNIIDLANQHTCAFIATEDIGKVHTDGSFEVSGRMDHALLRGCSLMTA